MMQRRSSDSLTGELISVAGDAVIQRPFNIVLFNSRSISLPVPSGDLRPCAISYRLRMLQILYVLLTP